MTQLGETSTQPRLEIDRTLFLQEHFVNADLDLHLSVTDRCMLVHDIFLGLALVQMVCENR